MARGWTKLRRPCISSMPSPFVTTCTFITFSLNFWFCNCFRNGTPAESTAGVHSEYICSTYGVRPSLVLNLYSGRTPPKPCLYSELGSGVRYSACTASVLSLYFHVQRRRIGGVRTECTQRQSNPVLVLQAQVAPFSPPAHVCAPLGPGPEPLSPLSSL